ncbi:MAG: polysaccharide biosynthesis C-terminal domain-containing protein [Pyrinomonadaceae bacterium]
MAQFGTMFLGIVAGIFVSRLLGPEGRGVFALFKANSEFLVLFLGFGLGSGVTYFTSNKKIPIRHLFGMSIAGFTAGSVLSALLILALPILGYQRIFFPSNFDTAWFRNYLAVLFIIANAGVVLTAFLNGRQRFGLTNFAKTSQAAVFLVFAVALFLYSDHSLLFRNTTLVLVALFASTMLSTVYLVVCVLFEFRGEGSPEFRFDTDLKVAGGFIYLVYLGELINFFNYRLDVWLVQYFQNSYQLGLYTLAVSVAQMLWLIATPVTIVLLPYLNGTRSDDEAQPMFLFYARLTFTLTFLSCVALYFVGEYLLPFVYGAKFVESVPAFRLLLIGVLFSSVSKVMSVYVVTQGLMRYNVLSVSAGVIVTFALDMVLIPSYGIQGASIATSVSYFVIFLFLIWVLRSKLELKNWNVFVPAGADFQRIRQKTKLW